MNFKNDEIFEPSKQDKSAISHITLYTIGRIKVSIPNSGSLRDSCVENSRIDKRPRLNWNLRGRIEQRLKGCSWMLVALHRHSANTLLCVNFNRTAANRLIETIVIHVGLNSELFFGPVLTEQFDDFGVAFLFRQGQGGPTIFVLDFNISTLGEK